MGSFTFIPQINFNFLGYHFSSFLCPIMNFQAGVYISFNNGIKAQLYFPFLSFHLEIVTAEHKKEMEEYYEKLATEYEVENGAD